MFDIFPHALNVSDIDSYIGLIHTLFHLEVLYGLTVSEADGKIRLKFNKNKGKKYYTLRKNRQTNYLLKKSPKKNTITGVTIIQNSILYNIGREFPLKGI